MDLDDEIDYYVDSDWLYVDFDDFYIPPPATCLDESFTYQLLEFNDITGAHSTDLSAEFIPGSPNQIRVKTSDDAHIGNFYRIKVLG